MNDLISRQDAVTQLSHNKTGDDDCDVIIQRDIETIKQIPSSEPQIIRCKDCNFWTKQKDSLQGRCVLMGTYPTGNWFCGNAERWKNETN